MVPIWQRKNIDPILIGSDLFRPSTNVGHATAYGRAAGEMSRVKGEAHRGVGEARSTSRDLAVRRMPSCTSSPRCSAFARRT